ncbi:unnamed protein product [Cunninghamella blakesleeana]
MVATNTINDIPIGYFVYELYLQELFDKISEIPTNKIILLHKACPNIEYIDTLSIPYKAQHRIPTWKKLTHIQPWVTTYYKRWYLNYPKRQQQQKKGIQYLEFRVPKYIGKVVQIEKEERFSFYNNSNNNNIQRKPIQRKYDVEYLLFKSIWDHLTHLSLVFGEAYKEKNYQLDDHTFESIHQSCPSLESLLIKNLDIHASLDYLEVEDFIQPCKKLSSLQLQSCTISHPNVFTYFSEKYTHLSTLLLYLDINSEEEEDDDDDREEFSDCLYHFIRHLFYLKHFAVRFNDLNENRSPLDFFNPNDQLFPHEAFRKWLSNSQHQLLQSLEYPYALNIPSLVNPIQLDENKNSPIYQGQQPTLLNDLFDLNKDDIDIMINRNNKVTTVYTLTSLTIHGYQEDRIFYSILHYLNTFPNLKTLNISYAGLYDFDIRNGYNSNNNNNNNKNLKLLSPRITYPLEKLILHHVNFYLNTELSTLFRHIPYLNELHWSSIEFSTKYKDTYINQHIMYVNLKHLNLDKVYLEGVYINQPKSYYHSYPPAKINVNEVNEKDTIKSTIVSSPTQPSSFYKKQLPENEYQLQIDCSSVDYIRIKS